MKTFRILTIIPLALISLMDAGYPFGTDPKPGVAAAIAVAALGAAGLVAVYGLARDTTWGVPPALLTAGANVAGAVVALVNDSDGAAIGLVVSGVALALALAASSVRRTTSPA